MRSSRWLRIQLATVAPDSWKTLCRCRVEMKCAAAMLAGDSCGSARLASMYSRTDVASSTWGFMLSARHVQLRVKHR